MIGILLDPEYTLMERFLLFGILALALLFSIILHEVAHGLVAYWNGDDTAKRMGRLSLNPARHLDPIGAVMLLFVGFGYAKPVPIDPRNFRHYRKGCILVSVAGVATNIVIAFLAAGFCVLTIALGGESIAVGLISTFFFYLCHFNIILFFFNILPLFPLDGFNLINALSRRENKFTRFMFRYGQYILIGLVFISIIVGRFGAPIFFSPLDTYFTYTGGFVQQGFFAFWQLLFGGI